MSINLSEASISEALPPILTESVSDSGFVETMRHPVTGLCDLCRRGAGQADWSLGGAARMRTYAPEEA